MDGPLEQAKQLFKEQRLDQAIPLLERVVLDTPGDAEASFLLGVCYFRTQNLENAEAQLRQAIGADPRHFRAFYYLGLTMERRGRSEEARRFYQRAFDVNPGFAEAASKLGVAPQNRPTQPTPTTRPGTTPQAVRRPQAAPARQVTAPPPRAARARGARQQRERPGCLLSLWYFFLWIVLSAAALIAGAAAGATFNSEMGPIYGAGAAFMAFQLLWAIRANRSR